MRLKALMLKQQLVFFLLFSFILFTCAVPSSRSLKSTLRDTSVQDLVPQEELEEDAFLEGRMDFGTNDYPDPGPNPGHDPKPPGPGTA